MARLGPTKKKKNSHAAELSQLKKEYSGSQRSLSPVSENCRSDRTGNGHRRNPARHRQFTDRNPAGLYVAAENAAKRCDAVDGVIVRPEGDSLRVLAKYGAVPIAGFLPFS